MFQFWGKRDITHLIYVKIKPYHFLCCFGKDGMVSSFSLNKKVSDEIKFQSASKRQIKIIYFYVIKTSLYKIITGDSQTYIRELKIYDTARSTTRPSKC